jgi:hypothetical protein
MTALFDLRDGGVTVAKASGTNYSKDAFHRYLVNKELGAVNPSNADQTLLRCAVNLLAGISIGGNRADARNGS